VISQSNNNVVPTIISTPNPLNLYVSSLSRKASAPQLTSSGNYSLTSDSAYSDSDSSGSMYEYKSDNSNLTCLMQSTTSPMSRINNFMDKEVMFQQAAAM